MKRFNTICMLYIAINVLVLLMMQFYWEDYNDFRSRRETWVNFVTVFIAIANIFIALLLRGHGKLGIVFGLIVNLPTLYILVLHFNTSYPIHFIVIMSIVVYTSAIQNWKNFTWG